MREEVALETLEANWLVRDWNQFVAHCLEQPCVSRRQRRWFQAACFFIGLVSLYDAYLVEVYKMVIIDVELNPIAWYMIKQSGNDVTAFLCAKALGTGTVLAVLALLHRSLPRLAYPIVNSVATFQLALLVFLHVA